jgi:glycosyltransferase involved in cell wall biosynthesis
MKIAMIGQKGIPAVSGGVEQHVDILSRELAQRGHEVQVYCRRSYCGRDAVGGLQDGVRRIFRPSIPSKHLDAITHTLASTIDVALRRADVVHYHAIGPALLSPLARLSGMPVVVTVHGLDWQRAKWGPLATRCLQLGERIAATTAKRLLVVSPTLCEHFQSAYGARAEFIPNGVIPLEYRQPNRINQFDLQPRRYLLTVARLVPEKGLHYLVDAVCKSDLEIKVVIAGGGGFDKRYEQQLRQAADDRIVFTGDADRELLAELYAHAQMFVLPSDLEGMSIALLEAMFAGLPVLVSDIPQNACVVQDAGLQFRAGDADHLREVLSRALRDPGQLADLGQRSVEQVRPFQWSKVVQQLERVYADCAGVTLPEVAAVSEVPGAGQTVEASGKSETAQCQDTVGVTCVRESHTTESHTTERGTVVDETSDVHAESVDRS